MALKSKVVNGKTVWYTTGFGLDENTTFDSKTKLYNYFGAMGVQPGQIDPSFGGGTHGGQANLGLDTKTSYKIGGYTFNAAGVITGGPCGIKFCDNLDADAKGGIQYDLLQAMAGTAVTKSVKPKQDKFHCRNDYGIAYMCGPSDPRYTGPKKKTGQQWMSQVMGTYQDKTDTRVKRKQKLYYDSRTQRKMKKYSRPSKR